MPVIEARELHGGLNRQTTGELGFDLNFANLLIQSH